MPSPSTATRSPKQKGRTASAGRPVLPGSRPFGPPAAQSGGGEKPRPREAAVRRLGHHPGGYSLSPAQRSVALGATRLAALIAEENAVLSRVLPAGTMGLALHPGDDLWEREASARSLGTADPPTRDDADAHAVNEMLGSQAVTIGGVVHWGSEAPAPTSASGRAIATHESAHVGQQSGDPGFTPVAAPAGLAAAQAVFPYFRSTLKAEGVSVIRKGGDNPLARMLRAVDRYWDSDDYAIQWRAMDEVAKEAGLWLDANPRAPAAKRTTVEKVTDAARKEKKDAESVYLGALKGGEMLADPAYAALGQALAGGVTERRIPGMGAGARDLARDARLTAAEIAAIKIYAGPAYKFINPALEGRSEQLEGFKRGEGRLQGYVDEMGASFSGKPGRDEQAKKTAAEKLKATKDPVARAIAEGLLHATIAKQGLEKLDVYTGDVYAGGAMYQSELFEKFSSGKQLKRKAFASTTTERSEALSFVMTKTGTLKRNEDRDDPASGYLLKYKSKTGRLIRDLSPRPTEEEVLFPPDSVIEVQTAASEIPATDSFVKYREIPCVQKT